MTRETAAAGLTADDGRQKERFDLRYWKTLRKKPNPAPGETKRGIPADYAGDDPRLCNTRTKSGRPCRALGVYPNGRCKVHGGAPTGLGTPACKATSAKDLRARRKLKNRVAKAIEQI
ncbi:HGGxSTG domain-containing protein [Dyella mobilis]|uniref:HGGxSTG domain-containing protein n=1 Tax=Dyella mobilis TaxID=1849582 RepID=UPI00235B7847|nr:hypothetical protein GCM10007863_27660 [Dyella mobilis]